MKKRRKSRECFYKAEEHLPQPATLPSQAGILRSHVSKICFFSDKLRKNIFFPLEKQQNVLYNAHKIFEEQPKNNNWHTFLGVLFYFPLWRIGMLLVSTVRKVGIGPAFFVRKFIAPCGRKGALNG